MPNSIELGDLDMDGKIDMLAMNGNKISLYQNLSSPGNIVLSGKLDIPVSRPGISYISELDGDGKPDLIMIHKTSSDFYSDKWAVSIFKNNSTAGTLSFATPVDFDAGTGTFAPRVAAGDMDQDGRPEIVIFGALGKIMIYKNQVGLATTFKICPNSNTSLESPIIGANYQWQQNTGTGFINIVNSANLSGTDSATLYLKNIPAAWNNYEYRCLVNSNQATNIFKLSISGTAVVPTAVISTTMNTICSGTPVFFTSKITAGGSAPVYQWLLNGTTIGNNKDTLRLTDLKMGDKVSLRLTSSEVCATPADVTSNTITMTVNPIAVPAVTLKSSSTSICPGETMVFTATAVHAGTSPRYEWANGWGSLGIHGTQYSTNALKDGDTIRVVLTSNALCASPANVVSNPIAVVVTNVVTPTITITGNTTVAEGTFTLINAASTNGGNTPSYQWQDSTALYTWQNIPGENGPSINYQPKNSGEGLRCKFISSLACVSSAAMFSAPLVFSVIKYSSSPGIIVPNPVLGTLNIDSLKLSDNWQTLDVVNLTTGQTVLTHSIANQTRISIDVSGLAPGLYAVVLKRNNGNPEVLRFVKM